MGLENNNKINLSLKKLLNKAHTQETFSASEESISSNISISYETIFADNLNPTPISSGLTNLYDTDGVVEKIKFEIDIIPDTLIGSNQSQGYRLKLPSDYTASGALNSKFSSGDYLHESLGKLQIVSPINGELAGDGTTEYDPVLYKVDGSTVIPKFDPINWVIDFYSGILFVQDPPVGFDISSNRPKYVEAFLYVGKYLNEKVDEITGGYIKSASNGLTEKDGGIVTLGGTLTGNTIFIDERVVKKGLEYNDDYSSGFTDNSLVNKKYVDDKIVSGITVSNGLTEVGTEIRLGGTLTGDTIFIDDRITKKGLEYADDYSSGFTDNSLVNKSYVDGLKIVTTIVTGSTTISTDIVFVNHLNPITITLPLTPTNNEIKKVKDISGNALINNITINGNGKNIEDYSDIFINTNYGLFELVYNSAVDKWLIISEMA